MYFSILTSKQVNCSSNFYANFFMIIIVRSIMKNYKHFFRCTILLITYSMCSTSLCPCIMIVVPNFTFFVLAFSFSIFIFNFFYKYNSFFYFHIISAVLFSTTLFFLFKINYLLCVFF